VSEDLLEWLLITAAVDLVARYMPPGAAKEFLLIELSAGRIRYRYQDKPIYRGRAFPLIYFWQRFDDLVVHEITARNSVIRSGITFTPATPPPPFKKMGEPDEDEPGTTQSPRKLKPDELRWILDPGRQATVVELPLVRLHRDDILRRLQEDGYLPLQHELLLSSSASPPNPERPAQAASSWDPLTDWSAEAVFRELEIKGPAITEIVEALSRLSNSRQGRYHGKTVIELLECVSAKALAGVLGNPRWEDSIGRLKGAWKKHYAKLRG
jgi:hypothetical protein